MSVEICAPAVIAIALARLLHEIVLDNGTAAKRSSNSIVLRRERELKSQIERRRGNKKQPQSAAFAVVASRRRPSTRTRQYISAKTAVKQQRARERNELPPSPGIKLRLSARVGNFSGRNGAKTREK